VTGCLMDGIYQGVVVQGIWVVPCHSHRIRRPKTSFNSVLTSMP
jgi:hypothetical protein